MKKHNNSGGGNKQKRNCEPEQENVIEESKNTAGSEGQDAVDDRALGDSEVPKTDDAQNNEEIKSLKEQLEKKESELKEYIDIAQRVKAEFENYKRRTIKEKEQLYSDITGDIIAKFLPVVDNLERAVSSASMTGDAAGLVDGVKMVLNQFIEVLNKEGVEEIEAQNKSFDPNYHNAVMHVEDENFGTNEIAEVFQKGYKIKDKVLRYSMVKVAN